MAKEYRGMRLRYDGAIDTKHLEIITHSASSSLAALRGRFDVVHYNALVPGLISPLTRAFHDVPGDIKLVLAGGSSHTDTYARTLVDAAAADPRVVLTGYVFGDTLAELYSNAAAFVQPSDLEGLPITLLEAASYGTPV